MAKPKRQKAETELDKRNYELRKYGAEMFGIVNNYILAVCELANHAKDTDRPARREQLRHALYAMDTVEKLLGVINGN
jgi:hypothetical protein